ncbi:ATPase family AAA domain-containing protein 5-like [Chironomus tepperi]|uniref:ATPase family AAA domain-containing protein 5-like n=1 Tax=Chironomus tepperi TaxID=113505 RepID=UPI00391FA24F
MSNDNVKVLSPNKDIKIVKWIVHKGSQVSNGSVLLLYHENGDEQNVERLKNTTCGTVKSLLHKEGAIVPKSSPLLEIKECFHTTILLDLCADCGTDLQQIDMAKSSKASVPMIHSIPELKVSEELAKKLGRADTDRLLNDRKLALLVDLDQTLIHTTNDSVPNNLKDVYHFQLYGPSSPWYHTRLRPGTLDFLKKIEQMYELHICTFGARNYAHMICTFLDENGRLFSHRILSRDECLNATSKKDNLKALFPDDCGDSMVCIIDDREDVWNYAKNLIQVKPYHFFQNTGDINAPPNLAKKELDGEGVDFKKYVKLQKASKSKVQSPKIVKVSNNKKSTAENQDTSKFNDQQKVKKQKIESNQDEPKKPDEKKPVEVDVEMKEESAIKETNEKDVEMNDKRTEIKPVVEENNKENAEKKANDVEMNEKGTDVEPVKDEAIVKKSTEVDVEMNDKGTDIKPVKEETNEKKVDIEMNDKGTDLETKIVENNDKEDITKKSEDSDVEMNAKNADLNSNITKEISKEDEKKTETDIEMKENGSDKDDADDKVDPDNLIEVQDPDDYLLYLESILQKIHERFYQQYDKTKEIPDLKYLIPKLKSEVLIGVVIVFSGLIPNNVKIEYSRPYLIAKNLGATVINEITDETTHLVAASAGTQKVFQAQKNKKISIVTPEWLWTCAERWEHVEEKLFPISSNKTLKMRQIPAHCSPERITGEPEKVKFNNPYLQMSDDDIASMEAEVEDDSSDTDSDDEREDTPEVDRVLRKRKRSECERHASSKLLQTINISGKDGNESDQSSQSGKSKSSSESETLVAKFRRGEKVSDMETNDSTHSSEDDAEWNHELFFSLIIYLRLGEFVNLISATKMDAEKIVENMKAVLKKAKRRKSCHKNKSQEASTNEEDKLISELMSKNWKMKTPPINKQKEENECDNESVKQKVNAFEKLMSRRSGPDSTSQTQKVITTPETVTDSGKKVKRKYTKKIKNCLNISGIEFEKSMLEEELIKDSQNTSCNGDITNGTEILPHLEEIENVSSNIIDSTKKRTRINDTPLETSSKKRKTRDNKMQLDSNENTIENTESPLTERPKRSCVNKIDYSMFAKSPDKASPEKKTNRTKSSSKSTIKNSDSILDLPVEEPKENIKLAPLFAKKAQKFTPEVTPKKEKIKRISENESLISPVKPVEHDDINKSGRPRRSCVSKIDYSQLIISPDKKSPEKRPLRKKSETENVISSPNNIGKLNIKTEEKSNFAPVFEKKGRKPNTKNIDKIDDTLLDKKPDPNEDMEQNNNTNQPETSQSGRPKRSCKSRIDYSALLGSPDKQSPEKKPKSKKAVDDDDVVFIDEDSPVKKTKQNVKLAPLFMKKVPKPAIDPAVLEARRSFLLSELPSTLRAPIEKQRQYEEDISTNDMIAFPKISHITQLTNDYEECIDDKSLYSKSKIRIIEKDEDSPTITKDMLMKCGLLTDCSNEDYNNSVIKDNGLKKEESKAIIDIKEAVRKIKDTSGTFPVNRCFKQILSKLKSAKENDDGNENGISHLNSSFVEIFKPTSFEEILIGLEPVKSLQEFLNTWNDKSGKYDNYESDDSSSRQSMRGMSNCVVLSGKNGSGKTSSVYALANDLNYEVIEINAGSKRNGKKILQDLLEATQSHRVEKNLMDDESSLDNFQSDVVDKKTIILIEDAELMFENDDGFISSIQQLINISKRPVILTTNDSNCQHLQKFIQHNEIIYNSPRGSVTKYLSLISIATANYQIDETEIEYLYKSNRYDLRKTINEIEFFVRSESANNGSLMELFGNTKNENRLQKDSQLAFHSRKDLSTLRSQSSIISDYSAFLSCSQQISDSNEISYHQHNLMNEMANFFKQSNLLKTDNQNDFTQWKPHQIISSSISDEICSLNSNTRAKNVDYSPLLRHICRSEKTREISRRTSRSHYLRFHLSNAVNSSNEYFNTQCSIFQEANEANGENV